MKFLLLLGLGLQAGIYSFAQVDREPPAVEEPAEIQLQKQRVFGKLVDEATGKNLDAVSVRLYVIRDNGSDSLVTGMLTRPNGDFSFSGIKKDLRYRLVFSAIGYEPFEKELQIGDEDGVSGSIEKDLGNIDLNTAIKQLNNVTVVASRPLLEMGIDRKVFNVEKSLTSSGGTAVDVMKNIPSVSVDIDGNVELRNSSPQIFIDGRPTILTLDQIPADNIEKVELITNPSAKFDAASSGGIINIVLKKNKRVGLNGMASVNAGTPRVFGSNLNLNLRQGKLNFFASGGYSQSRGKAKGETLRQNKENGTIKDYFNQLSENERSRRFTSLRFGVDYFIDNRNTITVSQRYFNGKFGNDEVQDQEYLDVNKVMQYYGKRLSGSESHYRRNSSNLNYTHKFPQEGRELSADINYNKGNHSNVSGITNAFYFPDGTSYEPVSVVNSSSSSKNDQVTFRIDYTNPIKENAKIETGIRVYYNDFSSIYNAFADENGQQVKLPLSNNYEYQEKVNAAYFTFTNKISDFGYQLGLRAEYSKFDGQLVDSAYKFGYEYPKKIAKIWDALFPSIFLSRKINEEDELQLNYSRRIRRPDFWQLNPFIDINDPVNLRQGNPDLKPEYINMFELNYSKKIGNSNLLSTLYLRNNPKDITQYSDTITTEQYQQLDNAAVDPNAILNTYINASNKNTFGAEFVFQYKLAKDFDITPSVDLQYRKVKARVKNINLDNKGFNFESKLIANYKITAKQESSLFNRLGFQLTGNYESPTVIPQGRRDAQYSVDLAMRKEFLKNNKGSLTFAVNDVFNTDRYGVTYDTESFYQDSYRRRNVRNFRITFSYKFGDANFSILRRGGGNDNHDD
ncbi:MAG: TonB-dependent receptor [Terrimonas sp.]|nr:TonB-dependent receptor [Terrimonas sp.]